MATKVYIVCKLGFEYNDEYYYRPESEGGLPEAVFESREEAQKEMERRNALAFAGIEPREYGYLRDISDSSETEVEAILEPFMKKGTYSWGIDEKTSLTDLRRIAKLFNRLKFYEIFEVES